MLRLLGWLCWRVHRDDVRLCTLVSSSNELCTRFANVAINVARKQKSVHFCRLWYFVYNIVAKNILLPSLATIISIEILRNIIKMIPFLYTLFRMWPLLATIQKLCTSLTVATETVATTCTGYKNCVHLYQSQWFCVQQTRFGLRATYLTRHASIPRNRPVIKSLYM